MSSPAPVEQTFARIVREATDTLVRGGRAGATTPATDSRPLRARGRTRMDYMTVQNYGYEGSLQPVMYGMGAYGENSYT